VHLVGVWLPRDVLARRIGARVAAMREQGLYDEVAQVRDRLSRTAAQAIGYKELADLDTEADLDGAFGTIERRTRSFARRQRMWFRRDPRITWLASAENPCRVLPALLAMWSVAAP